MFSCNFLVTDRETKGTLEIPYIKVGTIAWCKHNGKVCQCKSVGFNGNVYNHYKPRISSIWQIAGEDAEKTFQDIDVYKTAKGAFLEHEKDLYLYNDELCIMDRLCEKYPQFKKNTPETKCVNCTHNEEYWEIKMWGVDNTQKEKPEIKEIHTQMDFFEGEDGSLDVKCPQFERGEHFITFEHAYIAVKLPQLITFESVSR